MLVLTLLSGLSACAGGDAFDPATNLVTADNAAGETKTEAILARAFVLVKSKGAPASALAGTLINRSKTVDTLDSIQIAPGNGAPLIDLKPALALNPGQVLAMGTEAHEPLTVPDNGTLQLGHFVDVTLLFRTAGAIKMQVPVEVRDRFYSSVMPATGTTATQADRKLSNCVVSPSKTTKATGACAAATTEGARQAARAAASKAGEEAAADATTGAVSGKSTTTTLPSAKKPATRSTTQRAKGTAPAPAPAQPAPAAHAPDGH